LILLTTTRMSSKLEKMLTSSTLNPGGDCDDVICRVTENL
jgi:hypothetical protein